MPDSYCGMIDTFDETLYEEPVQGHIVPHSEPSGEVPVSEPKTYTHEQARQRRALLIEYAKNYPDASYEHLAEVFGYKESYVRGIVTTAGYGRGYHRDCEIKDPNSERSQIIHFALENGWTLQQLGDKLGVSRERARQLQVAYQKLHGNISCEFYYIGDVEGADQFARKTLLNFARKEGIGQPRGKASWVFNAEEARTLVVKYRQSITRTCSAEGCSNVFERAALPQGERYGRYFCSRECLEANRIRWVDQNAPLTADIASRWKPLLEELDPDRPDDDEYLPLVDAMRLSGASRMQMTYLRYRGVIRTRPAASGRVRAGVPHQDYSKADVLAVKRILDRERGNLE